MGPKGSATEDTWGSFMSAFESAQQNITNRGRLGPMIWPLFELFKDKNEEHSKVIRQWLDPLVQQALADKRKLEEMVSSPIADKCFLQHLADSTNGKSFLRKIVSVSMTDLRLDPVLIRDQLLSMLLASRDTVSALIRAITGIHY